MTYTVIYEKTSTGYSACVPDLPGCVAAARTLDQTAALMAEAVEMHLEAMKKDGEAIPEPTTVAGTVAVPA